MVKQRNERTQYGTQTQSTESIEIHFMKYKAIFPFTRDLGSFAPIVVNDKMMETKEQEALWYYNKAREHDGLPSLRRLPAGTKFKVIEE
jgi:hypothetical protein